MDKSEKPPYRPKSFKTPRKKKVGQAETVARILPAMGKFLNLDTKVQEWSLLALWDTIVDARFQGETRALRLRKVGEKTRLLVQASSAAIATDLSFVLETYRRRLNAYAPQTGLQIQQIDLTVG